MRLRLILYVKRKYTTSITVLIPKEMDIHNALERAVSQ